MNEKRPLTGTNAELRAGSLRNQIARHAAYRAQVAAQTEQRIRRCQTELVGMGFPEVELDPIDVEDLSDDELETLATGKLPEA